MGDSSSNGGNSGAPFSPSMMAVPLAGLSVSNRSGGGFAGEGEGESRGSALGTLLHRNRVQIIMPTPPEQAPKLDDGGDGGGLGKNNHNGGGGGDGGGDDDDYFGGGEDGDGEGGDGGGGGGVPWLRLKLPELFDRLAIGAVLQEWYKTVADLPLFIRRSVEMGLFSSAQLVRFLSMDVRPGATRAVSRALPTAWAREFVGRLMADPAFVQKLVIEQTLAFSASMLHEWRTRGDAFKRELDLAVINSMGLAAAVGAAVWITAPSRAIGAAHKWPWQRMLAGLPQCVFDASGPLRSYTPAARVGGFFASMAQLSAAGAAAGAATSALSHAAVALRRRADPSFEPSVPVPDASRASGGLGAFFALNANARYQLLGGLDALLFGRAAALSTYVALSGAARVASTAAGELTRPWWQGLATETAASHLQPRKPRVRKVKRRVVKRAAAAAPAQVAVEQQHQQQQALALANANPEAAALAALAAAGAGVSAAAEASGSGSGADAAMAAAVEAAAAETSTSSSSSSSSSSSAAAAEPLSLEAAVEERLTAAPALMGSPEGLRQLARGGGGGGGSFSDGAMGGALRDALSEAVA